METENGNNNGIGEESLEEEANLILDALLADDVFTKYLNFLDPAELALYGTLYIDASLRRKHEAVELKKGEVLIDYKGNAA